jgi:aspartate 1-decarboxylase
VIPGSSGQICLNGAAARLVQAGDQVIIASYAYLDESEADVHRPVVLIMGPENRIKEKTEGY